VLIRDVLRLKSWIRFLTVSGAAVKDSNLGLLQGRSYQDVIGARQDKGLLRPQALNFLGMVGEAIDSFGAREEVDDALALSDRALC
jgi:hypothetical protein